MFLILYVSLGGNIMDDKQSLVVWFPKACIKLSSERSSVFCLLVFICLFGLMHCIKHQFFVLFLGLLQKVKHTQYTSIKGDTLRRNFSFPLKLLNFTLWQRSIHFPPHFLLLNKSTLLYILAILSFFYPQSVF